MWKSGYESWIDILFVSQIFVLFSFLLLFRATPKAYGGSQAKSLIGAVAAGLCRPQQCQIQAMSGTYTTAQGNAGSLTC